MKSREKNPIGFASLILRCWPHSSKRGVWHGEVEHVQSGGKKAFQGLPQALAVLEDLLVAEEQERPD